MKNYKEINNYIVGTIGSHEIPLIMPDVLDADSIIACCLLYFTYVDVNKEDGEFFHWLKFSDVVKACEREWDSDEKEVVEYLSENQVVLLGKPEYSGYLDYCMDSEDVLRLLNEKGMC